METFSETRVRPMSRIDLYNQKDPAQLAAQQGLSAREAFPTSNDSTALGTQQQVDATSRRNMDQAVARSAPFNRRGISAHAETVAMPVTSEVPPPIEALGSLKGPTELLAKEVQIPLSMAMQGVLSAVTYSAQALANVRVESRVLPIHLYFLTISESGGRKTTLDEIVARPIRKHQMKLLEAYKAQQLVYDASHRQSETSKSARPAETSKSDTPRGPAPIRPILLINDATTEGVSRNLEEGYPSIYWNLGEGGMFAGGYSQQDQQKVASCSWMNDLNSKGHFSRSRRGSGHVDVAFARLTMHLQLQPVIAPSVLQDDQREGIGANARFLKCAPPSLIGKRIKSADTFDHDFTASDEWQNRFEKPMAALLEKVLPIGMPISREDRTTTLKLSPEAHRLYVNFFNQIERKQGENEPYSSISPLASKAADFALRLAAVLYIFESGGSGDSLLPASYVERGISLMDWYLSEELRIPDTMTKLPDDERAEELFNWLKKGNVPDAKGRFVKRDLQRLGPSKCRSNPRDPTRLDRALSSLSGEGRIALVRDELDVITKDGLQAKIKLGWRLV
jgi:hypothetical protein